MLKSDFNDEMLLKTIKSMKEDHKILLDKLDTANRILSKLEKGFPDGDIEGHRRFHQTQIQIVEEKRKLRQAIKEKTLSSLIWMLIVGLGVLLYNELTNFVLNVKGDLHVK